MRRRTLLLSGLGAAGALVVGWGMLPPRSRLGNSDTLAVHGGEVGLNGWIKIGADGQVLLAMNRSEMGQGIHTALAMLVAEELDVPLPTVGLVEAGPDTLYGNVASFVDTLPFHPSELDAADEPLKVRATQWVVAKVARELGINLTGGSSSVADGFEVLRWAAATARAKLLAAASLRWRLPVEEMTVSDGVVSHTSGAHAHFGELAKMAAAAPPADVTLKSPKDWRVIGKPLARIDMVAKTNGSATFGIDVRQEGQLFAAMRHCPTLGGSAASMDVEPVLSRPGIVRVVRLGPYAGSTAGVAVVGITSWHALEAAKALVVRWAPAPGAALDSADIMASLERSAGDAANSSHGGFAFHTQGDAGQALKSAARRVEAVYRAPFLAHATMEPINCTAQVRDGRVTVWAPTQAPTMARAIAARAAGVAVDAVTLHVTYLGGGFGRRLDVDFIGQAVRVAVETGGRPVQLLWSREEDIRHDFYRPAGVAVLRAGLNAQGGLQALAITSAGDAITPRWMERALPGLSGPVDLPDKTTSEGLFDLPYGVPHQRMAHVATRHAVPVGFWRSVGHSHNAFFSEAFVDEVAHEAGQDPVAFRLALLDKAPRHAEVLRLAAQKSGWGTRPPAGRARGVALHESFGSIVAQVVEVSLDGDRPRVHRVVCAADVGTVVNPRIVEQQMEGAIIYGLTAALYGRIDIVGGAVRQSNFPDYAMVKMAEAPAIETHLVPSTRPPAGVGEPGTPPVAPALANALFALTGQRIRELPVALHA